MSDEKNQTPEELLEAATAQWRTVITVLHKLDVLSLVVFKQEWADEIREQVQLAHLYDSRLVDALQHELTLWQTNASRYTVQRVRNTKRKPMTTPPISDDILAAMLHYGGSFVKQLSVLYYLADPENQQILETAFAHYFTEYAEMVKTATAQKRHFDD